MKKRNYICCFIAVLIFPAVSMGQWQADMTNSAQGNVQEFKVHSDGTQYRYDYASDDVNGAVIVRPSENITAIIFVDKKMVHYTPTDGMMSMMNDPVQAYLGSLQYGTEKTEGNEEVNGYDCIKTTIYQGEKALITRWFSKELNFPVKIKTQYTENTFMLLNNINKWKQDPSFFIVPEEYVEVDDELKPLIPEPAPPDHWNESEVNVPVDMQLSRGMAVNVPIDETVYHKFTVENTGDTPAKFSYHSFIDGVELSEDIQGPEEHRTQRLYIGEDYNMTMNWKAGQVILIKVYEGNIKLKIIKE